ncbi:hypothetical protein [Streptomyces sp. NPDC005732]|uniref:hypothetical protein n=1 Tax=Streptomyces sp. NPDC005732 TaxID=3157057 RepID=UPI0033F28CAE
MNIRKLWPRRTHPVFAATAGGVALLEGPTCSHGDPILTLHLCSKGAGRPHEDLTVLMPQCVASQLVGAALAFVQHESGDAASEQFLTRMFHARGDALRHIADAEAQQYAAPPTCCEAGTRTGGREHTCDRTATSDS